MIGEMTMPTETTKVDSERENDVRGSYAKLQDADDRRAGPWGDLQKLAKAFLAWDKTAKAADRRELQNFVSLRMTSENVTWTNELAFRDSFRRAIVSSIQYDPRRPGSDTPEDAEKVFGKHEPGAYARDQRIRSAFHEAITSADVNPDTIKAALAAAKGKPKTNGGDDGK
jgi:hypothetical protein